MRQRDPHRCPWGSVTHTHECPRSSVTHTHECPRGTVTHPHECPCGTVTYTEKCPCSSGIQTRGIVPCRDQHVATSNHTPGSTRTVSVTIRSVGTSDSSDTGCELGPLIQHDSPAGQSNSGGEQFCQDCFVPCQARKTVSKDNRIELFKTTE